MIFLKRIEAFGFKSFAEETKIDFEYPFIGVVGPNGSGKSNINDAIKWALGEQSTKNLRGDNMDDIVFSGSEGRSALNIAEVTLVFDNSKKIFSELDFNEVSVTRKFFKTTRENEYFINKSRVRLKDVQDLALETGLTKSSLAIISQGSISSFVESKPDDRRKLFDEAAGVSKYKKRKEETQRKIVRTQENIDRLNDILSEIERKLPSLKKQSSNASLYKEKFEELKQFEISIIIKDIELYKQKVVELNEQKNKIDLELISIENSISSETEELKSVSESNYKSDKELSKLNSLFSEIIEDIGSIKSKKISLESKKNQFIKEGKESRISELESNFNERKLQLNLEKDRHTKLLEDISSKRSRIDDIVSDSRNKTSKLDGLRQEIAQLTSTINLLQEKQKNNEHLHAGVKNVIENKKVLHGIIGTVQEMIKYDDQIAIAVNTLIRGSLQNIISSNTESTKNAIEFLKSNKAGRATFLPINNLKFQLISEENKFIIQKSKGFIGFANELVKIKNDYKIVVDYLMGKSIIMDNYDNALELSKITNSKFTIVTLDGEKIYPLGAIAGGSQNQSKGKNDFDFIIKAQKKLQDLKNNENVVHSEIINNNSELEKLREEVSESQTSVGSSKQNILSSETEIDSMREEYRILTGKDIENSNSEVDSVDEQILKFAKELKEKEIEKEDIQQQMSSIRTLRTSALEKQSVLNQSLSENRRIHSGLKERISEIKADIRIIDEKLFNLSNGLAQNYNLTFESASEIEQVQIVNEEEVRERISLLRSEIRSLGNINMDSIDEYNEENSRYTELVTQVDELLGSVNNFNKAIEKLDEEMIVQFKKIIKEVNKALPETFTTFFGGGEASVVYTDPNDVLNSGIEIKVRPPGKKISNLNLLSGGEKSMVALAVLFSILKVRPIPLVILDEVEAPLDSANVERFAKYIKTFTKDTQFLIVTHRTGTMENCDVLFGATMEQKGITKIVKLKLLEAKKLANVN